MKVREFIEVLKHADPDAEVGFNLGNDERYKLTCIKLALEEKEGVSIFESMEAKEAIAYTDIEHGPTSFTVILGQGFYTETYFNDVMKGVNNDKKITSYDTAF